MQGGYRRAVAHTTVEPSPEPPARGVLDASRGPLHPLAGRTLHAAVDAAWADPTRLHAPGRAARGLLDTAREVLAGALGVRPGELSVHASAEDALAVGLAGLRHARRRVGERVVLAAAERSVLLLAAGAEEPPLPVDGVGRVDPEAFAAAVGAPGVAAAVLQTANGEVGTRQPVAAVDAAAREAGVPLLLDATASLGRDPARSAGVGRRRGRRVVRWATPRAARRALRHPVVAPRAAPGGRAGARPRGTVGPARPRRGRGLAPDRGRGGRRRARGPRPRRAGARGRGRGAGRRGRRRPRRPAPPRRDVQRAPRRRRGPRRRARPPWPRRGVGLGVHLERAPPEPRARRDGRAHPRQRARRPPPGVGLPRPGGRRRAAVRRAAGEAVTAVRRRMGTEGL